MMETIHASEFPKAKKRRAANRGNYYRLRTQKWLEAQGYEVIPMEHQRRIFVPPKDGQPERVIFQKRDLWGSDLLASNRLELIAVQVKTNRGHIAAGVKELARAPWPLSVERWVVHWPERSREPEVVEVEGVKNQETHDGGA